MIQCAIGVLFLTFLAAKTPAGDLLGVNILPPDTLLRIDRNNASHSVIGADNAPFINGLAYDSVHDLLYGINPSTDSLYTINRTSGNATLVGPLGGGFTNANGLAYDPIDNILYGTDNTTNKLFTIDSLTGAATAVATIGDGFTEIEGLAYDPDSRTLFGLTQLQSRVVKINVATGQAIPLSTVLPSETWRGLEFDLDLHVLFATTSSTPTQLYRIDPVTGSPTFVGTMSGTAIQGLAYVPEPATSGWLLAALLLSPRRQRDREKGRN